LVILYSDFDIVSYFDIRISDLSPVIGRANSPDLTKLGSTLTLPCTKNRGVEKYDQNVEKLYTFISIRNKKEKSSVVREKRKGITKNVGYINISNHRAKAYPRATRACRGNEYPGISTT